MADQDGGGVTLGKFKFLRSLFESVLSKMQTPASVLNGY